MHFILAPMLSAQKKYSSQALKIFTTDLFQFFPFIVKEAQLKVCTRLLSKNYLSDLNVSHWNKRFTLRFIWILFLQKQWTLRTDGASVFIYNLFYLVAPENSNNTRNVKCKNGRAVAFNAQLFARRCFIFRSTSLYFVFCGRELLFKINIMTYI